MSIEFNALPVHDAILLRIIINREARTCSLLFRLVVPSDQAASAGTLTFTGLRSVALPFEQPWGPSNSVNRMWREEPDMFVVEIQSGDELRFHAEEFEWAAA